MEQQPFFTALLCTTLAGLCTGLGGLLVLWRVPSEKALSVALGFAGGVMLTVSLGDLLPAGLAWYSEKMSGFGAGCAGASLLLCGMVLAGLLGRLLPREEALFTELPTGAVSLRERRAQALHCGLAVGLALLLHNLPEGVLTLFSGVEDARAGLRLSLAIALHNIPEGISVAAPLWYATQSRSKSAGAAFLSGLAEPLGAVLAYLALRPLLSDGLLNGVMLLAAGVMCQVSVNELLFGGFAMGHGRHTALGFALGAAVMALGIAALA